LSGLTAAELGPCPGPALPLRAASAYSARSPERGRTDLAHNATLGNLMSFVDPMTTGGIVERIGAAAAMA
jgi:hypothetical protein